MNECKDCIIAGAAPTDTDIYLTGSELIIAADGGADLLRESGIIPHIVIGDMDSASGMPFGPRTKMIEFPPEKDDTDTLLAVREGLNAGCSRFFFYGCSGGRLDHTLANIQTLKFLADESAEGYIIGDDENMTVIKNSSLTLSTDAGVRVSVFSLEDLSDGITLDGLKYGLSNADMTDSFPIGVSNEAIRCNPFIEVKNGTLLIVWTGDFRVPERRGSSDGD